MSENLTNGFDSRRNYQSWEEAFKGLAKPVRQQSVRVAAYTQAIFTQACEMKFGKENSRYPGRMVPKLAELAYKCGMYHQIGKALVPEEYQIWNPRMTSEEQAVYKKYTSDGRTLVAILQENSAQANARHKKVITQEMPTHSISWLMVREACEQHMERWDGSGYPNGYEGDEISPIAQVVGIAKELDRIASERKSEDPFADAFRILTTESGTSFSPELIEVLKSTRSKCRTIYNKFIHYTKALPKTVSLVDKRDSRPMGLEYYPVCSKEILPDDRNKTVAYIAEPWFGGIFGKPNEHERIDAVEPMLVRTGMVVDMSTYFIYEACDTIIRLMNCKLETESIILRMMDSFYTEKITVGRFLEIFEDQPIDKSKLILTASAPYLAKSPKSIRDTVEKYNRNGINVMICKWTPKLMPISMLVGMGVKYVMPDPELYEDVEFDTYPGELAAEDIEVYLEKIDTPDLLRRFDELSADRFTGVYFGNAVNEDQLISDQLFEEREQAEG